METNLATVDQVLNDHASELRHDFVGYRNHVYRVANLCFAMVGEDGDKLEKIAVAAVFHDLGIWTNQTFDYIAPSVALAREHLAAQWTDEGHRREHGADVDDARRIGDVLRALAQQERAIWRERTPPRPVAPGRLSELQACAVTDSRAL